MGARTVVGADGRTWSVRRNIEWRPPAVGDEFEHDVDGGRGAALLILSSLLLFWMVLFVWAVQSRPHVPLYLWVIALVVLLFFPFRWITRRPWTLVAETSGGYDLPAEHWTGMIRGRGRATEEMRVLVRNLRTRATPGHADSPLHPVN